VPPINRSAKPKRTTESSSTNERIFPALHRPRAIWSSGFSRRVFSAGCSILRRKKNAKPTSIRPRTRNPTHIIWMSCGAGWVSLSAARTCRITANKITAQTIRIERRLFSRVAGGCCIAYGTIRRVGRIVPRTEILSKGLRRVKLGCKV
jgi:hypothetical protein